MNDEDEVLNVAKIKEKIHEINNVIKKNDNNLEWAVVILLILFTMFTMFYSDFQGTMDYAFQTVQQVMQGNFSGVKYIITHSYGMTMTIILMAWMIPFYPFTLLSEEKFGYYDSLSGAVWSKMFLSVMIVFFIIAIYKIAKLYESKYSKWIPLFILTSAFLVVPTVEIGQCDIIGVTFMSWGLYYYLKDDLKKFLIFFAIAIPMKYFALMVFVPLVLLREKNPIKIILQGIGGGSLLVINMLIRKIFFGTFMGTFASSAVATMANIATETTTTVDEAAVEAAAETVVDSVASDVVNNVAESVANSVQVVKEVVVDTNTIEDFFGPFIANSSLYVVLFIGICILAYAIKDNYKKWAIYIPMLVYGSFFLFTSVQVYWAVLMVPFLTLLIFTNEKQTRLSMILETIAGWAFIYISTYKTSWVAGGEMTFDFLFLRGLSNGSDVNTFLSSEMELDSLLPYGYSVYVACMIGLLIINLPCLAGKNDKAENEKFDRWVIWIRIGVLFCWIMFLVYLMLIRTRS